MNTTSKPIIITAFDDGYCIRVDADAAKRYGAKKRKSVVSGWVVRRGLDNRLDIISECSEPAVFTADDAKHVAHYIGRYLMGFGDMTFAYADAPTADFWERAEDDLSSSKTPANNCCHESRTELE
jgi:hypothetical protein